MLIELHYRENHTICAIFFFNDTATTEIYTLSLHDALPIFVGDERQAVPETMDHAGLDRGFREDGRDRFGKALQALHHRSEEHTSELQSRQYLVCRLLLEKNKHEYSVGHCDY